MASFGAASARIADWNLRAIAECEKGEGARAEGGAEAVPPLGAGGRGEGLLQRRAERTRA